MLCSVHEVLQLLLVLPLWENEVRALCPAHDIIPGGVSASSLKNMKGMHMPESSLRLHL